MWVWWISGIELTGKTEVFGKTRPYATLFTTSPSWTSLGSKAGSEASMICVGIFSAWRMQLSGRGLGPFWNRVSLIFALSMGAVERTLSHRRPVSAENLLSVLSPQLNLLSLIEEFEVPISSFCSEFAPRESISRQITGLLSWNIGSFF